MKPANEYAILEETLLADGKHIAYILELYDGRPVAIWCVPIENELDPLKLQMKSEEKGKGDVNNIKQT